MPEVQNVGAADIAQYQPTQYSNDNYAEQYPVQPEVYDEHIAEMQAASKSRVGATLFATVLVGGLIFFGAYKLGKHNTGKDIDKLTNTANEALKALEELKNSEAVQNYDKLKEAAQNVEKEITEHNPLSWWGIKDKVRNAFSILKKDSKKAAEEVKDDAKKAAEEGKEEAAKSAEKSKESAEKAEKTTENAKEEK